MNNTEVINNVQKETGKELSICEKVIRAYEEYCSEECKRPFKKEIDEKMTKWISAKTSETEEDITDVLTAFVRIVRLEIKHKIPFLK